MLTFIIVIHLMIVLAMCGLVLLQKSEGGGLGIGSRRRLHEQPRHHQCADPQHRHPGCLLLRHQPAAVGDRRLEPQSDLDPATRLAPVVRPVRRRRPGARAGNVLEQLQKKEQAPVRAAGAAVEVSRPKGRATGPSALWTAMQEANGEVRKCLMNPGQCSVQDQRK